MMNADGKDPHPIGYTTGDLFDAYATWSPDGSRIAFMRYREPVGVARVPGKGPIGAWDPEVLRLSDNTLIPIDLKIPDGLAALEWSPDGKQLLLVEHSGGRKAFLLDPDGRSRPVELPWTVESDGWWQQRFIPNAPDQSGWQRLATP
jgi:Tol biopolymer transport system component